MYYLIFVPIAIAVIYTIYLVIWLNRQPAGNDKMNGGSGNDTYVLNAAGEKKVIKPWSRRPALQKISISEMGSLKDVRPTLNRDRFAQLTMYFESVSLSM